MSKQLMARLAVLSGSVVGMSAANAAVDTAAITAAGADVALVGAAVFAVIIGVKVWKWIRAAA
ncbi:major capsid protein [Ideonella sp.]|uniref:major capsid protein n=1 Tax=Ideonella sp. TaxID=1929293 RepID=UPI0035AF5E71